MWLKNGILYIRICWCKIFSINSRVSMETKMKKVMEMSFNRVHHEEPTSSTVHSTKIHIDSGSWTTPWKNWWIKDDVVGSLLMAQIHAPPKRYETHAKSWDKLLNCEAFSYADYQPVWSTAPSTIPTSRACPEADTTNVVREACNPAIWISFRRRGEIIETSCPSSADRHDQKVIHAGFRMYVNMSIILPRKNPLMILVQIIARPRPTRPMHSHHFVAPSCHRDMAIPKPSYAPDRYAGRIWNVQL